MKKLFVSIYETLKLCSHPSHWYAIQRDWSGIPPQTLSDEEHLTAALNWLCRAQDVVAGGVSGGYFFKRGWMPPYPETTGYIIPTLLAAGYHDRALALGQWELEVQLPTGGVRGGIGLNNYPIVFNTGQVILGWTALFRATREQRFLDAAQRAADWLLAIQDSDGKWSRHTYLNAPRAYHSRVAWPLLSVYALTGEEPYRTAAERFLHWLQTQRRPNGGFNHMALEPGQAPITHTIAYTLRGLLECGLALGEPWRQILGDLVATDACSLLKAQSTQLHPPPARFPAALNEDWSAHTTHSCLPGNTQLAIVMLKLYDLGYSIELARAALTLIEQVKAAQFITHRHPELHGGVPASMPIWGPYVPYALPNWAAKFLIDALHLKISLPEIDSQ